MIKLANLISLKLFAMSQWFEQVANLLEQRRRQDQYKRAKRLVHEAHSIRVKKL